MPAKSEIIRWIETENGPIEKTIKVREFSPCIDVLGREYHTVIYSTHHPMMSDAPIRVHAIGAALKHAHANAHEALAHAYNRITKQAGRRTQANDT